MKKVLLSTTALVAAGLLVTSVAYAGDEEMAEEEMMEEEMMADEPVSVGISGYAYAAFGASTADDSPHVYQLVDLNLSGSATMDNGLTFSVASKLQSAAEQIVTIEGAFGSIALGEARSARGGSRIASPGATGMFGVNGPYQAGIAAAVGTNGVSHGAARDPKVVYTSPSVGGISLAASYAPGGGASDQISGALTFTQDLGDASVNLNVGYEVASMGSDSPTDLNAGASVAVGDITVSGGMWDVEGGDMQMDVGASMAMGALTLSAGWGNTATSDMYALAAGYPLGEGVALDMQLDFGENDGEEWVQFMIGTGITF